ncbi:MAG TPA: type II toxin-antitoxin system VapC family toxin [Candidatus Sulfomarinibacteraceae bacterium]|nr:type II toxin-antitoxin system VapC family toxin [Candidatus Sulfomarinibacteraceae bacterium]
MRYLLDTCVLSELVRPKPASNVVRWVGDQDEHRLFLSVVTIGELHKGVAKLPAGTRRARLETWVEVDLAGRFHGRVLPVDGAVAAAWGVMLGEAEAGGVPLPVIDALIGATAKVHGCAVVTRNVADLERTGAHVVNPW